MDLIGGENYFMINNMLEKRSTLVRGGVFGEKKD